MNNFELGYINKDKILKYVTQKEIFGLVFKIVPEEYSLLTSPFRLDKNPGCFFSTDIKGVLRFVDFGNSKIIDGIKMSHMDCFDAVRVHYNLPNFFKALEFVKERLIEGKNLGEIKQNEEKIEVKKRVEIFIEPRDFEARDGRYWSKYKISKQNLIDDGVFAVKKFYMNNTKRGDIVRREKEISYAYTKFPHNMKKIYRPLSKGLNRFLTNCDGDAIGEYQSLPKEEVDLLIISKSYKDCRVLRNQNLYSVWLQNEGMLPSDVKLIELAKKAKNIVVYFDNDEAGIKAAIKLVYRINLFFPNKSFYYHLPIDLLDQGIKDPADLIKKKGELHLKNSINNLFEKINEFKRINP